MRITPTAFPEAPPSLTLVPSPPPRPHHSPLALWHLLSLDAPTVATLWTLFIAHAARIHLPWPAPAAMFVAVWMIYAADRLLDARLLDIQANPDLEPRHRFHHHHRNRFLAALTISALTLVYLLHRSDPRALHLYVLLATLLAAWMLLIHIRPQPKRLPKELAVGLFFPAAIFIPTIARAPWLRPALFPAATLFACVCTLNCLYVYAWEHPTPRTNAHSTTRWATTHLTAIATLTLLFSAATAALHHTPAIALACALSAAALLILNTLRQRLTTIHLRAAVDLVLLTPLVVFPFLR